MEKRQEAFRSIGEVASLIGVAPHVLRYWETQFPQLKPMKRADGRRYYRPDDLRLAAGLCEVLRDDGLTIRGARKLIAADRGAALRQRGAQRLAQADPAEVAGQVLPDAETAEHPPQSAAPRLKQPRASSSARRADRADQQDLPLFGPIQMQAPETDAAPDTAPETEADPALRPAPDDLRAGTDLSAPRPEARWLGDLIALRRAMARLAPRDPRWTEAVAAAARLERQITGHPRSQP